jgi:hypothetical protein
MDEHDGMQATACMLPGTSCGIIDAGGVYTCAAADSQQGRQQVSQQR